MVHDETDFIVINKPAGIAVQNEAEQQGLLSPLCKQLNLSKLWLVHRLDKVTSGLLLLAKNSHSAAQLSQLFATRKVDKYYLALSDKKPKKKQGRIFGDMKKVRDGKWILTKQSDSPALTQFFSYGYQAGLRLHLLKPCTGKTHQLRVALKSLGSPILGDNLYTGTQADRTYLHAYGLRFSLDDRAFSFVCPPTSGNLFSTAEFAAYLNDLPLPWQLNWPNVPMGLWQKCRSQQTPVLESSA